MSVTVQVTVEVTCAKCGTASGAGPGFSHTADWEGAGLKLRACSLDLPVGWEPAVLDDGTDGPVCEDCQADMDWETQDETDEAEWRAGQDADDE